MKNINFQELHKSNIANKEKVKQKGCNIRNKLNNANNLNKRRKHYLNQISQNLDKNAHKPLMVMKSQESLLKNIANKMISLKR
jgi:predicted O-linked N-acetylglucosamine transferase (SPINDLY family)